jgi:hypothetical protein
MDYKKNQRLRVTTDHGKTSTNIPTCQNCNYTLLIFPYFSRYTSTL